MMHLGGTGVRYGVVIMLLALIGYYWFGGSYLGSELLIERGADW